MYNEKFMKLAIKEAKKCIDKADIPVCSVIVQNDKIISVKVNQKEESKKVTSHAEILSLEEANLKLNNWRLDDCDMYVTLEPCPMCGWAILNSRIKNLYFGSYDNLYGSFSTKLNLNSFINSKINIQGGMLEEECDIILKQYFKRMRHEGNT